MYKLVVKPEGIERRRINSGLVHIAAGCYLLVKGIALLRVQQYNFVWYSLPVFTTALASVLYGLLKKFIRPAASVHVVLRLIQIVLFAGMGIYFGGNGATVDAVFLFLWAAGCSFLALSERHLFHPAIVSFTDDGVCMPGTFSQRRLPWNNLADVVVRPDYLTIFKKDNRYLQLEVAHAPVKEELEELALFCKQQLRHPARATVKE